MQEEEKRTITSTFPLLILPSGLIRAFGASPGKVILCLDQRRRSQGKSRDEKLTPDIEVDHGKTVSVQNNIGNHILLPETLFLTIATIPHLSQAPTKPPPS